MDTSGNSAPLRVVIGEDDVLMREGLVRLLSDAGLATDVPLQDLSPGERVALAAVAEGKSNLGIARTLRVGARVEKHVTAVFRKVGIGAAAGEHRRVRAVLSYLHSGGRSP